MPQWTCDDLDVRLDCLLDYEEYINKHHRLPPQKSTNIFEPIPHCLKSMCWCAAIWPRPLVRIRKANKDKEEWVGSDRVVCSKCVLASIAQSVGSQFGVRVLVQKIPETQLFLWVLTMLCNSVWNLLGGVVFATCSVVFTTCRNGKGHWKQYDVRVELKKVEGKPLKSEANHGSIYSAQQSWNWKPGSNMYRLHFAVVFIILIYFSCICSFEIWGSGFHSHNCKRSSLPHAVKPTMPGARPVKISKTAEFLASCVGSGVPTSESPPETLLGKARLVLKFVTPPDFFGLQPVYT